VMAPVQPARATVNPEYMAAETRPEIISILAGLFLHKRGEATR